MKSVIYMVDSIKEALNIKNKNFLRYELYTARYKTMSIFI